MIEVEKDSLEAKVLGILKKVYPITAEELRLRLKLRGHQLQEVLKNLNRAGLVGMDVLPDKTFLYLRRDDILFIGRKPTQKRSLVKKIDRKKICEYEGQMYR